MRTCLTTAAVVPTALALSGPASAQQTGKLDIYLDRHRGWRGHVAGVAAGELLLIDTGYADGDRDAKRINAAAQRAGLKKIDYLVISHWHADHVGGLAALAKMIPIGRFFDHGDGVEPENQQSLDGYKAVAGDKRTIVKPGDRIP